MKLKPLGQSIIPRLASYLFFVIISIRNLRYTFFPGAVKKIKYFTVSIGCIHAGGTGKTPLSLLLGKYFLTKGHETVFLSRGYRRKSNKPVIVRPGEQKGWEEIGDEPAMLKRNLPESWLGIGADRYSNARKISSGISENAVFILDDGFQHRKIFRDINIVCLPPDPFNDYLIPAGYLREPISSLTRADIICLIGLKSDFEILERNKVKIENGFPKASVFILYQTIDQWVNTKTGQTSQISPFKSPLVISGIARPYRFIDIIRENGVTPCNIVSYEDHHPFNTAEIEKLCNPTIDGILTTEKDIMRLSTINLVNCPNICYLKVKLTFSDSSMGEKFLSFFDRK